MKQFPQVGATAGAASMPATPALRRLAETATLINWMSDASHSCVYLNPSAAALLDDLREFDLPAWRQLVHPEDLPHFDAVLAEAHASLGEYQVEYRVRQSNGSVRWMLTSGTPRFSADGQFAGFNGTVIDVSDRYRTLDVLTKSEAEHRLLAEYSPDLISHNTLDGVYLYLSSAYKRVLGYEPSELIGKDAFSMIHPEDQQAALQHFRQGIESQRVEFEYRKKHKAGHYVWLKTHISVLHSPVKGQHDTMIAVSHEISNEMQLREQLQQALEKYQSLTSLSSDWYWETDIHDRFTTVSDGILRVAGVRPDHIIGKSRADLVINPDAQEYRNYLNRVAARQPFHELLLYCRISGLGTERYLRISGEPIFKKGNFCGYRGIAHDVTSEVMATRQNEKLAAENQAIIAHSRDIMALIDKQYCFLRVNEAVKDILGYEPGEMLGQPVLRFLAPWDQEATKDMIEVLRNDYGPLENFNNTYLHKNGSVVYMSWTAYWAPGNDYMYCTGRNVTEQHKARLALRQANQQLSSVLERIGDAFYSVDNDWNIIYANPKALAFTGMPGADVAGRSMYELFPEFFTSSAYPILRDAMDKEEPTFVDIFYEPYQRWVEIRAYPNKQGLSLFYRDITDERLSKEAFRKTELRLRQMIERTPTPYLLIGRSGEILDANPALCELCGYAKEELLNRDILFLFTVAPCADAMLEKDGVAQIDGKESSIRHKGGHMLHVLVNASVERDQAGYATYLTAFMTDISERKMAAERLQHMATHDGLTGLPNRSFLDERLQAMLDTAPREEINAILVIDLDRFKQVNDAMGHQAGDVLLQEIARRLKANLRPGDIAARFGGDEFVVVAHCNKGAESAARIAQKLCAAIDAPMDIEGTEVTVGASIGISLFPQDGASSKQLFQRADAAMYKIKESGRNGYRFYGDDLGS